MARLRKEFNAIGYNNLVGKVAPPALLLCRYIRVVKRNGHYQQPPTTGGKIMTPREILVLIHVTRIHHFFV